MSICSHMKMTIAHHLVVTNVDKIDVNQVSGMSGCLLSNASF